MSQKQTLNTINPCRPYNKNGTQILTPTVGLGDLEKNSIRALLAYAALNTGKPEKEIQQRLFTKFSTPNIDHLAARSYEDVIKFLVDLSDEEPEEGADQ